MSKNSASQNRIDRGIRTVLLGLSSNVILAVIKIIEEGRSGETTDTNFVVRDTTTMSCLYDGNSEFQSIM